MKKPYIAPCVDIKQVESEIPIATSVTGTNLEGFTIDNTGDYSGEAGAKGRSGSDEEWGNIW